MNPCPMSSLLLRQFESFALELDVCPDLGFRFHDPAWSRAEPMAYRADSVRLLKIVNGRWIVNAEIQGSPWGDSAGIGACFGGTGSGSDHRGDGYAIGSHHLLWRKLGSAEVAGDAVRGSVLGRSHLVELPGCRVTGTACAPGREADQGRTHSTPWLSLQQSDCPRGGRERVRDAFRESAEHLP